MNTRGESWIRCEYEELSPELDVAPASIQFETSGAFIPAGTISNSGPLKVA